MIYLLGICLLLTSFGYFMLLWRLWLIDGVLDTPFLILFGGGAFIFIGIGIRHASIPLLWLAVFLMGGGSILYNVLDDHYEKNSIKDRYRDDVAKYKRRIEFNAADWMAMRELAKAYMKLEMYDEAIQTYKDAIRLDPPEVTRLRQGLNDALDLRKAGKLSDISICPHCRLETPISSKVCVHCGQPMRFEFWKFISSPEVYGDIVRYVVLALAALAVLVLLLSQLSIEVKAVLAMSCVIVGGFLLWRSIDNA